MHPVLRSILETPGQYGTEFEFSTFSEYLFVIARGIRNQFDHHANSQFFMAQLIEDAFVNASLQFFPTVLRRSVGDVTQQSDFELNIDGNIWSPISFKHSAAKSLERTKIWVALRWDDVDPPSDYGSECPMLIFLSRGTKIKHRDYSDLSAGFYYQESQEFNNTLQDYPLQTGTRTHSGFSYMNCASAFNSDQAVLVDSPSEIDLNRVRISFRLEL